MVSWMAGLLLAPRYRLHQLSSQPGEALFEKMKESSRQLRRIIMTPSIILVWFFGVFMIVLPEGRVFLYSGEGGVWLHVKILLVVLMSGLHGYIVKTGRDVDSCKKVSRKKLKLINEIPFLLLVFIVVLAVMKPV